MIHSTLQNMLNSPYMNSVYVQLQLCDFTNQNLSPYPNSIVVSNELTDGEFCLCF